MSKIKKTMFICLLAVGMYVSFSAVVAYQEYSNYPLQLLRLADYPLMGELLTVSTLYSGGILCIVCFGLILAILFYPKKRTEFRLKQTEGTLRISKKAIEGIVAEALKAEKLMKTPKVLVKMSKRKINIAVKGDIQVVSDLYNKTEVWSEKIEKQLHQLIGADVKVTINVKFDKPRVEKDERVK